MEENISSTQADLFQDKRLEALPKKSKEPVAEPSMATAEWQSLSASKNETSFLTSSIPPGQKQLASPATQVSWAINEKSLQDYKRDRVKKYAQYFQRNEILPIPELVAEVEPKTLSFIITDLRTRRLVRVQKNPQVSHASNFAGTVLPLGMSCCPVKLAGSNISTKHFQLQSEYRGKRQIQVTMCNVPLQLNGDIKTSPFRKAHCNPTPTIPSS